MVTDAIVSAASAVSAVLLICMLQVEFRRSSRAFRYSVKMLAACLLVSAMEPWAWPWWDTELLTAAKHIALLMVLGLVRWRQLRTGRCGAK